MFCAAKSHRLTPSESMVPHPHAKHAAQGDLESADYFIRSEAPLKPADPVAALLVLEDGR